MVIVILELSNYATKQQSAYAACVDRSNLATKIYFTALKVEIEKTEINKLVKVLIV